MFGFRNHRQSCFADSVLVAMFTTTTAYDHMCLRATALGKALNKEVSRLREGRDRDGWVGRVQAAMGSPWTDGTAQSAVDFFHALLQQSGIKRLGTMQRCTLLLSRRPEVLACGDDMPRLLELWDEQRDEAQVGEVEDFTAFLTVPGQHGSVDELLRRRGELLPDDAESFAALTSVQLRQAPVLVFEVGRNASRSTVGYGGTMRRRANAVVLDIDGQVYLLTGIVCRVGGHYVAFVWAVNGWYYYDDAADGGLMKHVDHPEQHAAAPSRFGELFFYQKGLI